MPGRTFPTFSSAEIKSHATAKSCWVTRGAKVYDVTSFVDDHPGGGDLILEYGGKDISEILGDVASHQHSEAAYEILGEYQIGFIEPTPKCKSNGYTNGQAKGSTNGHINHTNGKPVYASTGMSNEDDLTVDTDPTADYTQHKFLDLSRPLFAQLWFGGFSKQFYLEQVHRPRHYKGGESAPLFGNFLEPLTKTAWWVVPMIWLPCVATGATIGFLGLQNFVMGWVYFLGGVFIWTLVEYGLHRCLFHIDEYVN